MYFLFQETDCINGDEYDVIRLNQGFRPVKIKSLTICLPDFGNILLEAFPLLTHFLLFF